MLAYIASNYESKNAIKKYVAELQISGVGVSSTWQDEPHSPQSGGLGGSDPTYYAKRDLEEIDACDWFVIFSQEPTQATYRNGRNVELGYAIARKKNLLVIGPYENIFHYLPQFLHVQNWEDARDLLIDLAVKEPNYGRCA